MPFLWVLFLMIVGLHLAQPAATRHGADFAARAQLPPRTRKALIFILAAPMTYAYLLLLVRGLCPYCAVWWAGIFAPDLEAIMPSAEVIRVAWALAGNQEIGLVNAHALGFVTLWGVALVMFAMLSLTAGLYRHARAQPSQEPSMEQPAPKFRWWHGLGCVVMLGLPAFQLWSGAGQVDEFGAFKTLGRHRFLQWNALGLVFFAQIVWCVIAATLVAVAVSLGRGTKLCRRAGDGPSNSSSSG